MRSTEPPNRERNSNDASVFPAPGDPAINTETGASSERYTEGSVSLLAITFLLALANTTASSEIRLSFVSIVTPVVSGTHNNPAPCSIRKQLNGAYPTSQNETDARLSITDSASAGGGIRANTRQPQRHAFVGAGLLARRLYQSALAVLTHRVRQQAGSYT